MLQSLHVKNLALIDELEITFQKGFNIMTGETGAGKSIIIGSINLALGARYQVEILRKGAEFGFVELVFFVQNPLQIARLKELEIFLEDGFVILNRRFVENRSYARINGEVVTAGKLKQVAEILIDIHGQHEHQSLLYKEKHLAILDVYGKAEIQAIKESVQEAYKAYKDTKARLEENLLDERERQKKLSLLQFEVEEIETANLQEAEDEHLEEQYKKMLSAKKIREGLMQTRALLEDETGQGASDLLGRGVRAIQEVGNYDEQIQILCEQLGEIEILLQDFQRDLVDYEQTLDFSEEDFAEIESRLNTINHLKTKYGNTVEEIMAYYTLQEEELQKLSDYEVYIESLKQAYKEAEHIVYEKASQLSILRQSYATQLAKCIQEELLELNFEEVCFEIAISEKESVTEYGRDDVEFQVSLNTGEQPKALGSVASGGELSRIMLAIKTVLADKEDVETLIFDEIDVGISGRTAQRVSEKLALLSANHQVLCITHLAQIAAMADAHYLIEKQAKDNRTITNIRLLDSTQEIEELARILGGVTITDTVRENAREMKKLATTNNRRECI